METVLKVILYIIMTALGAFAVFILGSSLFKSFVKLAPDRRLLVTRIIFIASAVLIATSIITFNAYDYTDLTPLHFRLQPIIMNKCGVVGAIFGLWLRSVFGVCQWLIPALLLLWVATPYKFWQILPMKAVFLTGVTVLLCWGFSSIPILNINGGIIGDNLKIFLNKYFGTGKWYVIGAIILGTAFTFDMFRNLVFSTIAKIFKFRFKRKPKPKEVIIETHPPAAQPETPAPTPASSTLPMTTEQSGISTEVIPKQPLPSETSAFPVSEQTGGEVVRSELQDPLKFKAFYLEKLKSPDAPVEVEDEQTLKANAAMLESKFVEFGVQGKISCIAPGPVITRYEYEPAAGVKVAQIASLADDIALSMKSPRIRIEAPIPGKSAVGIEVPNQHRQNVFIKELLDSKTFDSHPAKLCTALGKDIAGEPVYADVAEFPHLLVAGTTGSGKSVFINTIIASILYRATPGDVRFLMIDPKRLELRLYNGIPHLVRPVISDAKESLSALKEVLDWMEIRYKEFAIAGVRDIAGYNQKAKIPKPYLLVIIDELADLMLTAPRDIEAILTRLAQMSRAVGIHLVLATQRPSVDIITGLIKANFPARIAFQVASKTDSRTILDMNGAEKLLGKGDMLFLPPGRGVTERLHGAYISTQESKEIADLWALRWLEEILADKVAHSAELAKALVEQDLVESLVSVDSLPGAVERIEVFASAMEAKYGIPYLNDLLSFLDYYPELPERMQPVEPKQHSAESAQETLTEDGLDELFNEAKELVIRHRVASVSLLQRHFKIGYARAGRIIDELERAGVIGPYVGSKSREVLVPPG